MFTIFPFNIHHHLWSKGHVTPSRSYFTSSSTLSTHIGRLLPRPPLIDKSWWLYNSSLNFEFDTRPPLFSSNFNFTYFTLVPLPHTLNRQHVCTVLFLCFVFNFKYVYEFVLNSKRTSIFYLILCALSIMC